MVTMRDIEPWCDMPYSSEFDCADFALHFVRGFFGKQVQLPGRRPRGPGCSEQLGEMSKAYGYRTDTPADGDFVLMYDFGDTMPTHCGVYLLINHEPHVFHSAEKAGGSVLHPIRGLSRLGLKIEGIYKWLET